MTETEQRSDGERRASPRTFADLPAATHQPLEDLFFRVKIDLPVKDQLVKLEKSVGRVYPVKKEWRFKTRRYGGVPCEPDTAPRINFDDSEFKAWFSGSIVKHSDGSPFLLWHGTFKDFEDFSQSSNLRPEYRKGTVGIYFSTDKEFSSSYGHNLLQVCLNVRNPKITYDGDDFHHIRFPQREHLRRDGFDSMIHRLDFNPLNRRVICPGDNIVVFDTACIKLVQRFRVDDYDDSALEVSRIKASELADANAAIKDFHTSLSELRQAGSTKVADHE